MTSFGQYFECSWGSVGKGDCGDAGVGGTELGEGFDAATGPPGIALGTAAFEDATAGGDFVATASAFGAVGFDGSVVVGFTSGVGCTASGTGGFTTGFVATGFGCTASGTGGFTTGFVASGFGCTASGTGGFTTGLVASKVTSCDFNPIRIVGDISLLTSPVVNRFDYDHI